MNFAFDCEVFHKYFCLCAVNDNNDELVVESHNGFISKNEVGTLIGKMYKEADIYASYNGTSYDIRIIAYILAYDSALVPTTVLKTFSDELVGGEGNTFVDVFNNDWVQWRSKHYDLLTGYTLSKSLKHWCLYRGWSVKETDVDFTTTDELTAEQQSDTKKYCFHDCHATLNLLNEDACQKSLAVRRVLVDEISRIKNCTIPFDYPQAKLAEEFIYAEDDDIPEGRDLGAAELVPWDSFDVPQDLKDMLKEIAVLGDFKLYKQKHGLKDVDKVLWNGISYGAGGAHFAAKGMHPSVHFFDVSSLYPSILVGWNMWKTPSANYRYANCYYTRLFDKGVIKEIPAGYSKIEFSGVDPKFLKDALKLVLNSPSGKLRQQYYTKAKDKAAGLAMCLIGQLVITEAALKCTDGHLERLVELNTDSFGVSDQEDIDRAVEYIKHTREKWPTIEFSHELTDDGSNEHGYQTYFRDVNNYCDMFEDGSVKAKGEEASELVKKKSQPVVIRSLWEALKTDKVSLLESDVFEDYVFKFSKSAGVRNFTIGGKPCDKKHVYMLFTDDSVGEDVTFSAERVNLQGVVKARHGVVAFNIEDLRPYFSHVDRSQYLEELKLLLVNWKPDLVSSFKEMFRSKRQKSKKLFIESLPTLKYLRYKTCKDAIEAEKYLLSLGWNFQP